MENVIGKAIKKRRNELNMTQGALSWESKVHQSYLSSLEGGRVATVKSGTLERIAAALGVPLSQIVPTAHEDTGCTQRTQG